MKKLIAILTFFVLTLTVNAQQYINLTLEAEKPDQTWKVLAIQAGSILLDAAGDALNDEGYKTIGHAMQAASVGVLVASPFMLDVDRKQAGWYAASYLCLRIGMFDPTYNVVRGERMSYIGNSSVTDKILREFQPPGDMQLLLRGMYVSVGVSITIKHF